MQTAEEEERVQAKRKSGFCVQKRKNGSGQRITKHLDFYSIYSSKSSGALDRAIFQILHGVRSNIKIQNIRENNSADEGKFVDCTPSWADKSWETNKKRLLLYSSFHCRLWNIYIYIGMPRQEDSRLCSKHTCLFCPSRDLMIQEATLFLPAPFSCCRSEHSSSVHLREKETPTQRNVTLEVCSCRAWKKRYLYYIEPIRSCMLQVRLFSPYVRGYCARAWVITTA